MVVVLPRKNYRIGEGMCNCTTSWHGGQQVLQKLCGTSLQSCRQVWEALVSPSLATDICTSSCQPRTRAEVTGTSSRIVIHRHSASLGGIAVAWAFLPDQLDQVPQLCAALSETGALIGCEERKAGLLQHTQTWLILRKTSPALLRVARRRVPHYMAFFS